MQHAWYSIYNTITYSVAAQFIITSFSFSFPKPVAAAASSSMSTPRYLKELDEEGETQEFIDFLSSLATEKGWISTQFYQYQGFWHTAPLLKGVLKFQTQFSVQPSDLYLVTTPKSGTAWLKAICFAIVNRVRFPSPQQHALLVKHPRELVPSVEFMYLYAEDPDFTCFGSPRLLSTHLPYVSLPEPIIRSKCKIVYLCRDPKDTLISLWYFGKKLKPENLESLEELVDIFCKGLYFFGSFWDHVLGYWKQSLEEPERVFFLRFEDMKREPMVHLRKLADFLGFSFSSEEENEGVLEGILKLCSFENLSNLEVNKHRKIAPGGLETDGFDGFFRCGEVGDWVNHLTPEMIERLDRITKEKLHDSGLKF